jgi:hypothetical protein
MLLAGSSSERGAQISALPKSALGQNHGKKKVFLVRDHG